MANTFVSGLAQTLRLPQAPNQEDMITQVMSAGMRQKEIALQQAWRERMLQEQEKQNEQNLFQTKFMPQVESFLTIEKPKQKDYEAFTKKWDILKKTSNFKWINVPKAEDIVGKYTPVLKGKSFFSGVNEKVGKALTDFWTNENEKPFGERVQENALAGIPPLYLLSKTMGKKGQ